VKTKKPSNRAARLDGLQGIMFVIELRFQVCGDLSVARRKRESYAEYSHPQISNNLED